MSIKFKSQHPEVTDELIIGGKDDSFSGNEKGGYGPFPSYSISREEIRADDGSRLNTKYTINITGAATIKPEDGASAMDRGSRQSKVYGEKIIKLQFNREKFPMVGNGILEINPYGSTNNQIKFYDAKLISVNIPDQTEESSGMHYTEYNFVFEAYSEQFKDVPDNMVSSVSESWELSPNDGQYTFAANNLTGLPFKTFTLTHTLSATGVRKYDIAGFDSDGEAWRQAAKWIESRLVDDPNQDISSHIDSITSGPKFNPFYMGSSSAQNTNIDISTTRLGISYKAYNHSRTSGIDSSGGGYNVTDTWLVALDGTKCIHELESSIENNQEGSSISVTVSGSVSGLSDSTVLSNQTNKYTNAKIEFDSLINSSKPFDFAKQMYDNINPTLKQVSSTRNLRDIITKKSVGYNKITGMITWSITYTDQEIIGDEAKIASEEISINYDNDDLSVNQIAIIPVIGRPRGPIIQSFATNKERKVSLTLDLVMRKEHRSDDPPKDVANSILQNYQPAGSYINSRSDNWNKKTGAYSVSIEWVYR